MANNGFQKPRRDRSVIDLFYSLDTQLGRSLFAV